MDSLPQTLRGADTVTKGTPTPTNMEAEEVLTLSMHKSSKIIGLEKQALLPFLIPDWRWDLAKSGTCAIKVKMVQGLVLDQEAHQSSLGKGRKKPYQPHGPWPPGGSLKPAASGNKLSYVWTTA